MVNIFGGISVWHNILQSYGLTFLCIRFFSRGIIHGKNHGFIERFFWKWVSDRNSGRNRWRFRSARIRIQVLWSAAVFFEILFTNAVRDYIKCFYVTENSVAVLCFGGVSRKSAYPADSRWLKSFSHIFSSLEFYLITAKIFFGLVEDDTRSFVVTAKNRNNKYRYKFESIFTINCVSRVLTFIVIADDLRLYIRIYKILKFKFYYYSLN